MSSLSSIPMLLIFQVALITLFWLPRSPCYADDTNEFEGSGCYPLSGPDKSPTWTENLKKTFSSLEANVTLNNGYYKAEAGTGPDKAYSLIQCRGDIPMSNCLNCTRESFRLATEKCERRSSRVEISQKWCYLRYSNVSFYGVWDGSGSLQYPNSSISDDPIVTEKGKVMMTGLVAVAPKEALMFAKSEIDDGMGGKRYGLVQCTRDLGESSCRDCLEYLLTAFGIEVPYPRDWDAYAVGCFMFYHDSQFYFNDVPAQDGPGAKPNAANSVLAGVLGMVITILTTAMAFL